jgi:hypothetical protein
VLANMFCPRANQERFDLAVRLLEVPVNAPTVCSTPAPNEAVLGYRVEAPPRLSASDLVLDRNQYKALVTVGSNVIGDGRHPPVIPRSHLDSGGPSSVSDQDFAPNERTDLAAVRKDVGEGHHATLYSLLCLRVVTAPE